MSTFAHVQFPGLVGDGRRVATILGTSVEYLDADAAATTRPLALVQAKVQEFLGTYGSVHRGSGAFSRRSTELFVAAREVLLRFVGGEETRHGVCFTHNTTAAINKLRRKLDLRYADGDRVFLSEFEHSSNDLPWRSCHPVRIPPRDDGVLDLADLQRELARCPATGRKLVAVTGASNLTGALTDLPAIARLTHRYGGMLLVDAAQLAAHRPISMRGTGDGDHLDFVAFCGHKMYAPYGAAVLIGDRRVLADSDPDELGGGTVDFVTPREFDLTSDLFRRENPGTPNATGAVAMAIAAAALLDLVGFDAITQHEQELLDAAREHLPGMPGLRVLGPLEYLARRKCAVLSFVLEGCEHGLLAARLSHEFGIGVRHGHLCQFAYVARQLGLAAHEVQRVRQAVLAGDRAAMYGVVRASFGLGNRPEDMVRLAAALEEIAATPQRQTRYARTPAGEWLPAGFRSPAAGDFFRLAE